MKVKEVLKSTLDESVNFIFDNMVEARLVNRKAGYISIYVSSHTGCNKSCRMCHLTQTGQTSFDHVTADQYAAQAKVVWEYYLDNLKEDESMVDKVYINFMSRGEPFANKYILENGNDVLEAITNVFKPSGVNVKFQISTILPTDIEHVELSSIFDYQKYKIDIHYSLYSLDAEFRKKWIPKSINPYKALDKLRQLQLYCTDVEITLHWAFIEGENDSMHTVVDIIDAIEEYSYSGFECKINIVRYNPYSENQGKESSEEVIKNNVRLINSSTGVPVKIIPRVGHDVKASCGTFVY